MHFQRVFYFFTFLYRTNLYLVWRFGFVFVRLLEGGARRTSFGSVGFKIGQVAKVAK